LSRGGTAAPNEEETIMQLRHRAAVLIGGAVALVALGGGAAFAATQTGSTPSAPAPNVAPAVPAAPAAPGAAESTAEAPETGSTTDPAGDAPGGHADPAGANVDHQFNGNE
jgi:hypothetical protein